MGDIDYIFSKEGVIDRYILCWFDDEENDFSKAWRRLTSVTFTEKISLVKDKRGKSTYNAVFKAKTGKL
jgi:hypothetical protein